MSYIRYEGRRPKHEPSDSYFYLARQLTKCIIRADVLNLHVYPVRAEMTGVKHILISQVCSTDNNKAKDLLVDKNLAQVMST